MPLHIIRDVAITIRSFYKRINDFLRYRQATKDMDERYADATREEMAREDVCIICRETMTAWTNDAEARGADQATSRQQDQRLRPKKLPCGHILHFACLRSWLERQQNCPTCRRPVLSTTSLVRLTHNQAQPQQHQPNDDVARADILPNRNNNLPQHRQNRVRVFNFGPIRLGIGAGPDLRGLAEQIDRAERRLPSNQPPNTNRPASGNLTAQQGAIVTPINSSPDSIQRQLQAIEQQLMHQISSLQVQADQLHLVRNLQGELARIRINSQGSVIRQSSLGNSNNRHFAGSTQVSSAGFQPVEVLVSDPQSLPPGMTLPEGWTLLPLRRITDEQVDLVHNLANNVPSQSSEPLPQSAQTTQLGESVVESEGTTSGDCSGFSGEHREVRPTTSRTVSNSDMNNLEAGTSQDEFFSTAGLRSSLHSDSEQNALSMDAHDPDQRDLAGADFVHNPDDVATTTEQKPGMSANSKYATVEDYVDDST